LSTDVKLVSNMGIGIVLLFWAVAGTIIASFGALVFGGLADFLTDGAHEDSRRRVIRWSWVFPLRVFWMGRYSLPLSGFREWIFALS